MTGVASLARSGGLPLSPGELATMLSEAMAAPARREEAR
jgi:hypothetical protein